MHERIELRGEEHVERDEREAKGERDRADRLLHQLGASDRRELVPSLQFQLIGEAIHLQGCGPERLVLQVRIQCDRPRTILAIDLDRCLDQVLGYQRRQVDQRAPG